MPLVCHSPESDRSSLRSHRRTLLSGESTPDLRSADEQHTAVHHEACRRLQVQRALVVTPVLGVVQASALPTAALVACEMAAPTQGRCSDCTKGRPMCAEELHPSSPPENFNAQRAAVRGETAGGNITGQRTAQSLVASVRAARRPLPPSVPPVLCRSLANCQMRRPRCRFAGP